jgi:hypothetical protein
MDIQDLQIAASGKGPQALFQLASILCFFNHFGAHYQGTGSWALMRHADPPFATFKPAFWRQKDKNQNDNTQNVPLPTAPGVIPKKYLFQGI